MQWIYRKKRNDQEHHEKVSFFHLANFECFFLFVLFLENVLFNSHVVSLTHAGKRSNSRSQMFSKTGVLKNFAIFTGKNLCSVEKVFLKNSQNSQENNCTGISYFSKGAGLRPATLLKKTLCAQVFSCKFCEIFKSTFFIEHMVAAASFRLKSLSFCVFL